MALLFSENFPELRILSIMSHFKWSTRDIESLHKAVTEGRMPSLQHLCIRFGNLHNHGKYLVGIMDRPFLLETVDLMDTHLSKRDGQLILAALKADSLPNIKSLNLLENSGLNSLVPDFQKLSVKLNMDIQCTNSSQSSKSSCFLAVNMALKTIPKCTCGMRRRRRHHGKAARK